METERLAELMAEIGGALGAADAVELPEGAGWYVSLAAGAALLLSYDPLSDRLLLSGRLGRPEPALRAATYGLLLAYNGRSKETGGGWIGLEEPGGEAILRYAAPAGAADADTLRGLILAMLQTIGALRAYVGRKAGRGAEPDPLRLHVIRG